MKAHKSPGGEEGGEGGGGGCEVKLEEERESGMYRSEEAGNRKAVGASVEIQSKEKESKNSRGEVMEREIFWEV